MQLVRAVHDEPIPGYRLLEPLGKGGFGEVWKCSAPGGLTKAVKFVAGSQGLDQADSDAEQELRALEHIKSLRHPFLLSIERVELVRGDLVIVTELADRSMHDLLTDYRTAGHLGIPRPELLAYLREAAEVLDVLHLEHGLQHLDIKPRNLFLVGRHVKVADFGLVASLADLHNRGDLLSGITPLYAAPEVFEGRATLFSDQYSLAVTYHELMTGETPYKAKNSAMLAYMVSTTDPDLGRLPETDREVVRRAMFKDARRRYRSCTEFVEALVAADPSSGPKQPPLTSYEFCLGDLDGGTKVVPAVKRSGVLRRETRVIAASATVPTVPTEQLAGYQLLECLGRGPAGELWRARGPRGDFRLVRFLVPPDPNGPTAGALQRLMSIHHPSLAEHQVHPLTPDRLALVSEAGETSLAQRLRECRAAGQVGVPRAELLGYFSGVAQALDEVYHKHQLQHLTLTPRHLALSHGEAIVLEFGLAELLWVPQGLQPASLSPRYAAVELFDNLISDACDQFSLALMFQELLVGQHPYRNLNARQMASPKLRGQPDLALLPAPDRPVIAKALDTSPERRFRSCAELVLALEEASRHADMGTVTVPVAARPTAAQVSAAPKPTAPPEWKEAVEELVYSASRGQQILSQGQTHYRIQPGLEIEQRALARLVPGMARLKLSGFREQWQGEQVERTESSWVADIRTKSSFLQRCLGRAPGLRVEVVLGAPRDSASNLTPIRVRIEPVDCGKGRAEHVLGETGPAVLASLQTYLGTQGDRAMQERFRLTASAHIDAPTSGLSLSAGLVDLGMGGMALRTKERLPVGPVTVTLNRLGSPLTVRVPGRVRDCREVEGEFEVEVEMTV